MTTPETPEKSSYKLKEVIRDGLPLWKLCCPNCGVWGDLDDDQFNGRVSTWCDCGFHETINFAAIEKEARLPAFQSDGAATGEVEP